MVSLRHLDNQYSISTKVSRPLITFSTFFERNLNGDLSNLRKCLLISCSKIKCYKNDQLSLTRSHHFNFLTVVTFSTVSATTMMGLLRTWASARTCTSSRLSYIGGNCCCCCCGCWPSSRFNPPPPPNATLRRDHLLQNKEIILSFYNNVDSY